MKFMRVIGLTHLEKGASVGLTLGSLKRAQYDDLLELRLAMDVLKLSDDKDMLLPLFQTVAMKPK